MSDTQSTVEFLGSTDQVLLASVMDGDQATVESMVTLMWPLMPKVWAVRFTTGGDKPSRKVLRRPAATSVAPRVRPNPIRLVQRGRRGW